MESSQAHYRECDLTEPCQVHEYTQHARRMVKDHRMVQSYVIMKTEELSGI